MKAVEVEKVTETKLDKKRKEELRSWKKKSKC